MSRIRCLNFTIIFSFLIIYTNYYLHSALKPMAPSGIRSEFKYNSNGTYKLHIRWNPVTRFSDGTPLNENLNGYYIFRNTANEQKKEIIKFIRYDEKTEFFQEFDSFDFINNPYIYRVYAVRNGFKEEFDDFWSDSSMLVDTSINRNIISVSKDERFFFYIPKQIKDILYKENNIYNEDIHIICEEQSENIWKIKAIKSETLEDITEQFFFDMPLAEIKVTVPAVFSESIVTQDTTDNLTFYWSDGKTWINIGGETVYETANRTIRVKVAKPGIFMLGNTNYEEVQLFRILSVFPKVFTPAGPAPYNSVQIIYEKLPEIILTGKIYDINGCFISDMSYGIVENSFAWNGKTSGGYNAPPGIYIYEISAGVGKNIKGTVVLAR